MLYNTVYYHYHLVLCQETSIIMLLHLVRSLLFLISSLAFHFLLLWSGPSVHFCLLWFLFSLEFSNDRRAYKPQSTHHMSKELWCIVHCCSFQFAMFQNFYQKFFSFFFTSCQLLIDICNINYLQSKTDFFF